FMLLALVVYAHGQAPSTAGDPAQKSKLRILAVSTPPLADEALPEGGLILALLGASLKQAAPGATAQIDVRWTTGALTQQTLNDPSVDLALPVEGADCERPGDLAQASAVLCDAGVYSDPILQVVLGLFSLSNSPFKFDADESVLGKSLCLF